VQKGTGGKKVWGGEKGDRKVGRAWIGEKVKGVGWGPHQELINDLLPMKLSFQTNVSILSLSR